MLFRGSCFWIILSVSIWWEVDSCTKDSKTVGICLHTYLERDFPAIEMIVYPNKGHRLQREYQYNQERTLLFDGPELQSNCHYLEDTLKCYSDALDECNYYEDLYEYQQLLESLTNIYTWLCQDINTIRDRFLVLLQSLECLEWVRMHTPVCVIPEITENIWPKILRLETNSSICPMLQKQRSCLLQSLRFEQICSPQATEIYQNMSMIFLEGWCNKASKETYITKVLLILSLISIIYCNLKY